MDIISSLNEVLQYLRDQEIVYTITKGVITYFYLRDGSITVKNPSAHYKISLDQFKQLFGKENFYLYVPKDEAVNTEKDDEYYAWKSRNAH